jgi:ADP-ribose pyrophosphatase YjhB (NUDIX family)
MLIAYYAYRFIQPKYSVGVIGVVFNAEGQVLLVEHVFHPRLPWGLPGGWVGNNEDPALAVVRELREELALQVTVQRLLVLEKTEYNHLDLAFLCEAQNEVGTVSYELIGYRWHSTDTLPRLHRFHYSAIQQALQLRQPIVSTAVSFS